MSRFSLFGAPVTAPSNQTPENNITLAQAYAYIISSEPKAATLAYRQLAPDQQKQRKVQAFKAATFSGVFSGRTDKDLQAESKLLCIDIDHAPAQGWPVDQLKDIIARDSNLATKLAFVSPSADGLKVVVERPEGYTHRAYFEALQRYFKNAYNMSIDSRCGNISRLCFLPYDPKAHYNEKASITPQALQAFKAAYSSPIEAESHAPKAAVAVEDKTGIAGAFCRCYTIPEAIEAFLPDIYTPTDSPNRYTYTKGSSYGGLIVMNEGHTAYSHHSTDPAGGRACSAFDLVRIHKFGADAGGPSSESYKDMAALAAADPKVKAHIVEADFSGILAEASTAANFTAELQALLDQVQPINFRKKAEEYGLAADAKLTQKIILVVAIRELLKQVEATGAGLTSCNGRAYVYGGNYWREVGHEEMQAFLTAAAIALGMQPNEAQHFEAQEHLYKQFEATARLAQPHKRQDIVLVNFQNGTLEIEGSRVTLRQPRRADFLKYQLPYCYDPGAGCPTFRKYLYRVLPDDSAQAVLAEFIGNTLAPSLNLQKALVLYGAGCNGKSVFCEIVTALLGRSNVSSYSMDSLTKQDSRSRAELENKLLNYCGENSIKLGVEAFKALVRNEPIEVRRLYEEAYIMEHYARLMFNCNQLPKDIEQTEGFFRSFLIIPFKARITEAEKDPQLAAKIIATELPGIFNWLLEGLKRLLVARRYTDCEAARQELDNYRKESSSVLMFLEDCEIKPASDTKSKESLQTMYNCYNCYCQDSGHRFRVNKRTFANTLRELGYTQGRDRNGIIIYCVYNRSGVDY